METMSRGGTGLPTSLSGGGLAHLSIEVRRRFTDDEKLLVPTSHAVNGWRVFQGNVKSPVKRRSGLFPRLLSIDSQTEKPNQRR